MERVTAYFRSTAGRARSGRRDERGSTTVAQTVLVAPVLLFILMLIVQFGLFFHARNVAEQAAQEGAAAARQFDGSAAAGSEQARQFLSSLGPSTLRNQNVAVTRGANEASATISGTVISLVPGVHLRVSETAAGPVERYVAPTDQGAAR